jgi:hypothetical protein
MTNSQKKPPLRADSTYQTQSALAVQDQDTID